MIKTVEIEKLNLDNLFLDYLVLSFGSLEDVDLEEFWSNNSSNIVDSFGQSVYSSKNLVSEGNLARFKSLLLAKYGKYLWFISNPEGNDDLDSLRFSTTPKLFFCANFSDYNDLVALWDFSLSLYVYNKSGEMLFQLISQKDIVDLFVEEIEFFDPKWCWINYSVFFEESNLVRFTLILKYQDRHLFEALEFNPSVDQVSRIIICREDVELVQFIEKVKTILNVEYSLVNR